MTNLKNNIKRFKKPLLLTLVSILLLGVYVAITSYNFTIVMY